MKNKILLRRERTAYFLRSLDFLFLPEKESELFAILPKNSEEERMARKELFLKNILLIKPEKTKKNFSEMGVEEIIKHSDLTQKLKEFKINCLFIKNSSNYLRKWSLKNKTILFVSSHRLREKFENKIYFEKLLRRLGAFRAKSRILNSKRAFLPFPKTVLQIPNSTGGEGTFIANSRGAFKRILRKLKIPLLAREYKEGMPLGVSLFITKEKIYISAIDRQCLYKTREKNRLGLFKGIQWLPYTFFTPKAYKKIKESLLKIGKKIRKRGLMGLVNLDFILNENNRIYFLECNPRITAATPQIIAFSKLNGNVNFLRLFLNHYCNKKFFVPTQNSLPKSLFLGAQMVIKLPSLIKFPKKIKRIIKGGFFVFKKGKVKKTKLKNRFDFLKLKRGLFFYNEINKGEIYEKEVDTGTIISNFPLYDFKTGDLNKFGKIVYNFFSNPDRN